MYKVLTKHFDNKFLILSQQRSYACLHAGKLKANVAKPIVNHTDTSGHHQLVTKTECVDSNCKKINCADPATSGQCPGRTPIENQTSIPNIATHKTKFVGNFTSKIPKGFPGGCVDPLTNASGQVKPQDLVVEQEATQGQITTNDFTVNQLGTKFAQKNHIAILNIVENNQ